ncbi:MOB kinase activator-like 2, partial [Operophtera brumata]
MACFTVHYLGFFILQHRLNKSSHKKARRKERDGEPAGDPKLYLQEALLERKLPELDMRRLVELPDGLDYNEWLASHSKYLAVPAGGAELDYNEWLASHSEYLAVPAGGAELDYSEWFASHSEYLAVPAGGAELDYNEWLASHSEYLAVPAGGAELDYNEWLASHSEYLAVPAGGAELDYNEWLASHKDPNGYYFRDSSNPRSVQKSRDVTFFEDNFSQLKGTAVESVKQEPIILFDEEKQMMMKMIIIQQNQRRPQVLNGKSQLLIRNQSCAPQCRGRTYLDDTYLPTTYRRNGFQMEGRKQSPVARCLRTICNFTLVGKASLIISVSVAARPLAPTDVARAVFVPALALYRVCRSRLAPSPRLMAHAPCSFQRWRCIECSVSLAARPLAPTDGARAVFVPALALFDHVNLLYGAVSEFCTPGTCAEMAGPGGRCYAWYDERGKKARVAAPQYVDYVMTYTQRTGVVRRVLRLLFHVLAHLYAAHFRELALLRLHAHLHLTFAHLTALDRRFALLDHKETEVRLVVELMMSSASSRCCVSTRTCTSPRLTAASRCLTTKRQ